MKQNGFTLMELMITVAIVAVLAAVAVPSYSSYVQKSRRSEAFSAMTSVINAMEKFKLSRNVYPANVTALDGVIRSHGLIASGSIWTTAGGNYEVRILSDVTGPAAAFATPRNAQASDTQCGKLWLFLDGRKQGRTADGASDTTSICWPD